MLFSSDTKGKRNMDIKTRVLVARLAVKIDENKAYSKVIRTKNTSHYRKPETERRKTRC